MLVLLACVLSMVATAPLAHADESEFDEDFSDFGDMRAQTEEKTGEAEKPAFYDFTGSIGLSAAYGFDRKAPTIGRAHYYGFNRLRAEADLRLDLFLPHNWKARIEGKGFYDGVYTLRGRSHYTDPVLDHYEEEFEFFETFLQGSILPSLDLKTGRQIVNWGYADSFRVLDVLNPLDNREPGLVDIEDLRLPITMTVIDYFLGDWTLSGIAIHERRFDKSPEFGNPFYPDAGPPPPAQKPKRWGFAPEYAFSVEGTFHGLDVSARYARVYDKTPSTKIEFAPPNPFPIVHLVNDQISVVGIGLQATLGSWLFKSENAYRTGIEFAMPGKRDPARLDTLVGVEYYGLPNNQSLALEVINEHLHNWERQYEQAPDYVRRNQTDLSLRYTANFFNEKLDLILVGIIFQLGDQGGILRVGLEYELSDSLTLNTDVAIYQGGDNPILDTFRHNDRIAMRIQYHF